MKSGVYELHITLQYDEGMGNSLLCWTEANGLKYHHIILDSGTIPVQPMVTARYQCELAQVRDQVKMHVDELQQLGFSVIRVKIEADPANPEVPVQDEEWNDDTQYFEHHVKLLLSSIEREQLRELVAPLGARPSRNARRVRDDGLHELFVTQRCRHVGRLTAKRRLSELIELLRKENFTILTVEQEYVVLDDAPGVDAGWLEFQK